MPMSLPLSTVQCPWFPVEKKVIHGIAYCHDCMEMVPPGCYPSWEEDEHVEKPLTRAGQKEGRHLSSLTLARPGILSSLFPCLRHFSTLSVCHIFDDLDRVYTCKSTKTVSSPTTFVTAWHRHEDSARLWKCQCPRLLVITSHP